MLVHLFRENLVDSMFGFHRCSLDMNTHCGVQVVLDGRAADHSDPSAYIHSLDSPPVTLENMSTCFLDRTER